MPVGVVGSGGGGGPGSGADGWLKYEAPKYMEYHTCGLSEVLCIGLFWVHCPQGKAY